MTALTVVMISGQSRRSSSHDDSNGGSDGFKDSDGFNDDQGFATVMVATNMTGVCGTAPMR